MSKMNLNQKLVDGAKFISGGVVGAGLVYGLQTALPRAQFYEGPEKGVFLICKQGEGCAEGEYTYLAKRIQFESGGHKSNNTTLLFCSNGRLYNPKGKIVDHLFESMWCGL